MQTLTPGELTALLRASGFRVTMQRLGVYEALRDLQSHATPEQVVRAVRARFPTVSANTVYETLDVLERAGAIRRGDVAAGPLRYDVNIEPHHHLVCRRCGAQTDVPCGRGTADCVRPEDLAGFTMESAAVTFFGVCAACAADTGHADPSRLR